MSNATHEQINEQLEALQEHNAKLVAAIGALLDDPRVIEAAQAVDIGRALCAIWGM